MNLLLILKNLYSSNLYSNQIGNFNCEPCYGVKKDSIHSSQRFFFFHCSDLLELLMVESVYSL